MYNCFGNTTKKANKDRDTLADMCDLTKGASCGLCSFDRYRMIFMKAFHATAIFRNGYRSKRDCKSLHKRYGKVSAFGLGDSLTTTRLMLIDANLDTKCVSRITPMYLCVCSGVI